MEEIIKEILKFGFVPAFLLIVVILLIQDPDRAIKIKALITEPLFKLMKWFSKEYIASSVTSNVNEFFKRNIFNCLVDNEKYKFQVKWVSQTDDPVLSQNGTLILRLKEENDQTRNIISAVQVALPHVICPLIRNNISQSSVKAIDLTILQKLATKLGRHGMSTFRKYFLDPETNQNKEIGELVRKLLILDKHGFFVPIFLNELELVEEGIFAENDLTDYTEQTYDFLNYLLSIVNREIGCEIELTYLKFPYNIGTILLAKQQKADKQGLRPYLKRLRINLDQGCESIYIISFPPAFSFFEKLIDALDGHERVFVKNVFYTTEYELNGKHDLTKLRIVLLRKNDIYVDEDFNERLKINNVKIDEKVKGIVEHVSRDETLVNVVGMRAYINRRDCSWISVTDCSCELKQGEEYTFQVKNIDRKSGTIHLTRRFDEENPWYLDELPRMDEIITVNIKSREGLKYTGLWESRLEVFIPMNEVSWFILSENSKNKLVETYKEVKVIEVDEVNQRIFCSLKQVVPDPWPIIHKSLTKGSEFLGKVIDVTAHFVDVELPNRYNGRIPKESLEKAGYEYRNFKENIVIGQGLEVVISKVFISKKRIRLDLKRNIK